MGYEISKFGGGSNTPVTTDVHTHFGPRPAGGEVGVTKTEGKKVEVTFEFTAAELASGATFPLLPPELPKDALVIGAYAKVTEAFALGGTTPVIDIGTAGSEGTNGVNLTEAQAEAEGTYDIFSTVGGTWSSDLAAKTVIDVELGGTSPTVGTAGRAEVVIEYIV